VGRSALHVTPSWRQWRQMLKKDDILLCDERYAVRKVVLWIVDV
jgi:hypothetical protein